MNTERLDEFSVGVHTNGYEDLAIEIILLAVRDYQTAYRRLDKVSKRKKELLKEAEKYPNVFLDSNKYKEAHRKMHLESLRMNESLSTIYRENYLRSELQKLRDKEIDLIRIIRDCESFFCGDWISMLTTIGGKNIKAKLDYELIHKGISLLDSNYYKEN